MTARELIEKLERVSPDRIVVLSIDPEGNGYHELFVADTNYLWRNRAVFSMARSVLSGTAITASSAMTANPRSFSTQNPDSSASSVFSVRTL
jgi:hypothetical protein